MSISEHKLLQINRLIAILFSQHKHFRDRRFIAVIEKNCDQLVNALGTVIVNPLLCIYNVFNQKTATNAHSERVDENHHSVFIVYKRSIPDTSCFL